MKNLIITNHSYMLWQFRRELIAALMEHGNVVISMPFVGHEDDFEKMGCKCIDTDVDRRGINPIKDFKLLLNYFKLISSEKPDKVITYSIKPNIYAGLVCRLKKIDYFTNVQGLGTAFQNSKLAKLVTTMYKAGVKKASTVFFENSANADIFIKRKIVSPNKIKVLNGAGVNLEHYFFCDYPKTESTDFLFVGRIMKEKGIDELYYAIRKLKDEFGDKVNLDIIGFFEDEYKDITETLNKDGIIRFQGFQTDARPYYKNCGCVVLPSYHEGLSNVLLEASAMGRPVITSDIPGCRETVENELSGYLVETKNGEALYEAMKKFVLLSAKNKADMGYNARKKVEKDFDKADVVRQTINEIFK